MGFPRGVSLFAEGFPLTVVAIPHVVLGFKQAHTTYHTDVHLLHRSFSPEQLLAHQLPQCGSDVFAGYLFFDVLHWHHRDRFYVETAPIRYLLQTLRERLPLGWAAMR